MAGRTKLSEAINCTFTLALIPLLETKDGSFYTITVEKGDDVHFLHCFIDQQTAYI